MTLGEYKQILSLLPDDTELDDDHTCVSFDPTGFIMKITVGLIPKIGMPCGKVFEEISKHINIYPNRI